MFGIKRRVRRDPKTGQFRSTNPLRPPTIPKPYRHHAMWRDMTCVICGQHFKANRRSTMYCSNSCRIRSQRERKLALSGLSDQERKFVSQLQLHLPQVAALIKQQKGTDGMKAAIKAISDAFRFATRKK